MLVESGRSRTSSQLSNSISLSRRRCFLNSSFIILAGFKDVEGSVDSASSAVFSENFAVFSASEIKALSLLSGDDSGVERIPKIVSQLTLFV